MSDIKLLPLTQDMETKIVLKKLAKAHQALAELKGVAATIPNEGILISTLSLQEAKDSSEIENIITTLVKQGLLKIPVLYLSRYINQHKADYYRLLQATRDTDDWQPWLLFILDGIEQTSMQTVILIERIKAMMLTFKQKMRTELPKIYSQDLLNNLFRHPYTKIDFIMTELNISRITAVRYLNELVRIELLIKRKIGRDVYYINTALYELLGNAHQK